MKNKCEQAGFKHAWVDVHFNKEACRNCTVCRMYHTETKKWYSYSDGRPDEPII